MQSDLYLFRASLKDLLQPKKLLVSLLLILLPASISVLWRAAASEGVYNAETAYNLLSGDLVFGFVLTILAVIFGTGVIAQEIEAKTIVYLLTRPVPRWRVLLVRFLAAVLVVAATVCLASIVLALASFGPGEIARSRLGRDLAILPVGVLAYCGAFLLLAVLIKRPLLVGLFFAFGWESWVAAMPGDFKKLSLMAYLRTLAPHPKPESETLDLTQLLSVANPKEVSATLAWEVLAAVIVVSLIAAVVFFSVREFVPREDAD